MTQTTNPAPKKPHHSTVRKEKAAAMDRLLEQYGSIEEMKAKLDAAAAPAFAVPLVEPTISDHPVAVEPPAESVERVDPLAWITKDTPYVALVSGTCVFGLWPGKDRRGFDALDLPNASVGPWMAMPFQIVDEDRVQEQNERVMKSNWWHHKFERTLAQNVYAAGKPTPETAVQSPEHFEGWNQLGKQAKGTYTTLAEFVPLREEVRRLLQRFSETFLDWSHHRGEFDPRVPNPYRNRLASSRGKLKPEMRDWVDK